MCNEIIPNLELYKISTCDSMRKSIQIMNVGGIGICVCVDNDNNVIGTMTAGDFRKGILRGCKLDDSVMEIVNTNFISVPQKHTTEDIENIFENFIVQQIPVIENGKLVNIITAQKFFEIREGPKIQRSINLPVVIMAGGQGTRLEPFTKILPKPLIPIGEKPMIEIIMNAYTKFGMNNFYICINYKGKMIRAYLEDSDNSNNYHYITENKPLGTAGALKKLKGLVNGPFFVSNCDILIKDNYCDIYEFHKNGNFALTMVAAMQSHIVPYGVCEIENGGVLKTIKEKPQYDFLINSGMYLLNSEILDFIPDDKFFHITHLIEKLQKENYKVGVYPISEKSWVDVGQWSEYKRTIKQFRDLEG